VNVTGGVHRCRASGQLHPGAPPVACRFSRRTPRRV